MSATAENFHSITPSTKTRVWALIPGDPTLRQKYIKALEALAEAHPVDGLEPSRSVIIADAVTRISSADLGRFDSDDGTDYAQTLADAYFAARADFVARSGSSTGTA